MSFVNELVTKFSFNVDFEKLERLQRGLEKSKEKMEKVAQAAEKAGQKWSLYVTAPIMLSMGAMVHQAAELEDSLGKVRVVFGDALGKDAAVAIDILVSKFGMAESAAAEMLSRMGMAFQNLGFSEERSLGFASDLTQLAVDMKNFANSSASVEDVTQSLQMAFLGSTRALRQFGVAITEDEVKKRQAENAAKGVKAATDEQSKSLAVYSLILEKTQKMRGETSRSAGEFEVEYQRFKGTVANMAASFGHYLLPIVGKVLKFMSDFFSYMKELSPRSKMLLLALAGILAAVGPILLLVGTLGPALIKVGLGVTQVALAMRNAGGAVALLTKGFKALWASGLLPVLLIFLMIDDIIGFIFGDESLLGSASKWFEDLNESTSDWMNSLGEISKIFIFWGGLIARLVITPIRALSQLMGAIVGGDFSLAAEIGKNAIADILMSSKRGTIGESFATMGQGDYSIGGTIGESFATMGQGDYSIGSALGFGTSKAWENKQVPVQNTITNSIKVDSGLLPPEQAGPYIQRGVSDGIADLLKMTQHQTVSPIVE